MIQQMRLYSIGLQDFPSPRQKGSLYMDKTEYIYRMMHSCSEYMFLNRPRRFGNSLLISTLQAYFEGRKDLFEGLAIEKLEKDCTTYPVIRLDMSLAKHQETYSLERYLMGKDYSARFSDCGLPIIKVGMEFDQKTRTFQDWKIEKIRWDNA